MEDIADTKETRFCDACRNVWYIHTIEFGQ